MIAIGIFDACRLRALRDLTLPCEVEFPALCQDFEQTGH